MCAGSGFVKGLLVLHPESLLLSPLPVLVRAGCASGSSERHVLGFWPAGQETDGRLLVGI